MMARQAMYDSYLFSSAGHDKQAYRSMGTNKIHVYVCISNAQRCVCVSFEKLAMHEQWYPTLHSVTFLTKKHRSTTMPTLLRGIYLRPHQVRIYANEPLC